MSTVISSNLKVGYNKTIVLDDIEISVKSGEILCLMGPNGCGKSTVLKTLIGQIAKLDGAVLIDNKNSEKMSPKERAHRISVVLTERVNPEDMTGYDVVSSGRFSHTGLLGRLDENDEDIIRKAIEIVNGTDLKDKLFNRMSDGERQRIMIARAIAQEADIMILDEPTSFLDVRYKIEVLNILRKLASEYKKAVILSLHEIDLAPKIADKVLLIECDGNHTYGTPESVLTDERIRRAFSIEKGSYFSLTGITELPKPDRKSEVFVVGGGEKTIPVFRCLNKKGISFSCGVIFENDISYPYAKSLAEVSVVNEAFVDISENLIEECKRLIDESSLIIDAGTKFTGINQKNQELLDYAGSKKINIVSLGEELEFAHICRLDYLNNKLKDIGTCIEI